MTSFPLIRVAILAPLLLLFAGVARAETVAELIHALESPDAQVRAAAAMDLSEQGEQAAPAIDALRKCLKDSDPLVRAHAARALGHIGQAALPTVDDLVLLIADPEAHVRHAAFNAIRRLKPGRDKAVPLMLKALSDREPAVVLNALQTLSEIGEEVVPPMIEALKDPRTEYWACLVLTDVGPAAKEAVPQLTKTLASEKQEVRLQAAMALGAIGAASAPAVPELTKTLDDKESGVRYAAVFALGNIGAPAVGATAQLEKGLKGDDLFMKAISVWALALTHPKDEAFRDKLKHDMLESLLQAVKDKNRKVRFAAVNAIHELKPGPEVMVPAFARLVANADPETIANVMEAIASLGDKAVPGLIHGLKHPDVRGRAAEILGRIGEPAAPAVPALIEALKDERPEVRREVLFALGAIGPEAKAAVPEAHKALKDPEPKVRYSAVWALGRIGAASAEALPDLEKNCGGDDPFFSSVCAWALVRIDAANPNRVKMALPVLIKALEGERSFVQIEAANSLGMIGPAAKEALPALKKLTADKDPDVAKAAADAINKINGSGADDSRGSPKPEK